VLVGGEEEEEEAAASWRRGPSNVGRGSKTTTKTHLLFAKLLKVSPTMSLSVPQNGVKAEDEPVIELFVKVRRRREAHGRHFYLMLT